MKEFKIPAVMVVALIVVTTISVVIGQSNMSSGNGGSGTVSANNGSAGAIAFYSAAGGSTTVAPNTHLTETGSVVTNSEPFENTQALGSGVVYAYGNFTTTGWGSGPGAGQPNFSRQGSWEFEIDNNAFTAIPNSWGHCWSTSASADTTTFQTCVSSPAAGILSFDTSTVGNGLGQSLGTLYSVPLTATAALTAGQTVKIDSANNSSVIVGATTDTGAGIIIGIVSNSPGAAGTANVVTSGNILTPVLGTGTCTKGQFVIQDTTTAGRVQCTGTYTAGTVIGKCTVAQAVVGSAVGVMVGLR